MNAMNALADFLTGRPHARRAAALAASALLAFFYARGGPAWPLGFVAFVPWLLALDGETSLARSLLGQASSVRLPPPTRHRRPGGRPDPATVTSDQCHS